MYYCEQGKYYQLTIFVNINCQKHQMCIPYSAIGRQNICRGRRSYPLVTTFYRDSIFKCALLGLRQRKHRAFRINITMQLRYSNQLRSFIIIATLYEFTAHGRVREIRLSIVIARNRIVNDIWALPIGNDACDVLPYQQLVSKQTQKVLTVLGHYN